MSTAKNINNNNSMSVIGYRLEEKFIDLDLIGQNIEDFNSDNGVTFEAALEGFQGLVLYHGSWNAALEFITRWESKLKSQQFIVLFFSTDPYVKTIEECRKVTPPEAQRDCEAVTSRIDLLPYIHLMTYSVASPPEPQIMEKFKSLISAFLKLENLKNEQEIIGLWDIIDPAVEQMTDLIARIRDLEYVIASGSFDRKSFDHVKIVKKYYKGPLPPYEKLRDDYLRLCRTFRLKKKLSRWQTERESLNHRDFQHYFYDLIARPSVIQVLDSFSSRQCEVVPTNVISILEKWDKLRDAFSALFLRANPEAVASCKLNLALLTPEHKKSAIIIQHYKDKFGAEIEAEVAIAKDLLKKIDCVVNYLLGRKSRDEAAHLRPITRALGTELVARCKEFSTQVSSLRFLANLDDEVYE